jgi:hypothetical protein
MTDIQITCNNCQRTWTLPGAGSVYWQLELSSRPCPFCEAYTLSYGDAPAAHGGAQFRPSRSLLRAPAAAPSKGG